LERAPREAVPERTRRPAAEPEPRRSSARGALDLSPGAIARSALIQAMRAGSASPAKRPRPRSATTPAVLQGYLLFNPAAAGLANPYNQALATTFEGQDKAGSSFMNLAGTLPQINNVVAPALRVSQNGLLAIEDADLATRQPKHFFAAAGSIAAWNETLEAQGSYVRLIQVPGETVSFTTPAGVARTLVKTQGHNLVAGSQGNAMTIAQQCDNTVQEVLGNVGTDLIPKFVNAPATALPALALATHQIIQQYYIGAELAAVAGVGGVHGGLPGGVPLAVGGVAPITPHLLTIAGNYGAAMHTHKHVGGGANPALDARMQHLGVNEYAAPEVGEGLVTHKLGSTQMTGPPLAPLGPATPQLHDQYNNRIINNPGNNNVWGFHWAGVVAKDGPDYITLENYARNAEDAHLHLSPNDPRFYFQMYGAGAQSWHERWAALNAAGVAGVREFANPLTMVVATANTPALFTDRAQRNYGGAVAAIQNDHNTIAAAANADQLTIALLKGLAFADSHIQATGLGHTFVDWNRLASWRAAVNAEIAAPRFGGLALPLAQHVHQRLALLKRSPVSKIKSWFH